MTVVWNVIYTTQARKDLANIEKKTAEKIILLMDEIALEPYGLLEKITNSPFYKFRVGAYRGIVNIVNDKMVLQLVKVKHRSQAYKK